MPVHKIPLTIKYMDLIVTDVTPSPITDKLVISFKETFDSKEGLLITWSTVDNEEITNLSTSGNYFIVYG